MVARLTDSLTRQKRALRTRTTSEFLALDEEFHRLLAESVGRPAAWEMIEDVKPQMDRVRFLDMSQGPQRDRIVAQHATIVDAIKDGDPARAIKAMQDHLGEILLSLPEMAAKYPDLFEPAAAEGQQALSA
jgi:DNA-binding GntR family transcriptional regulator